LLNKSEQQFNKDRLYW